MTNRTTVDLDFRRQVEGFSLTTAEILYRMPDYRHLLQTFVWQQYDMFPQFPKLHAFLQFWQRQLDGPLVQVRVAHAQLIRPAELKLVGAELRLH